MSVDGVSIEEIGYYELVNRIRGEVDTYVTVGVLRDGEVLSFTMQRKMVEGVSVSYRHLSQDQTIGYVKIEQFDQKTASDDFLKSAADNNTDCKVNYVAAHSKLFEFFKKLFHYKSSFTLFFYLIIGFAGKIYSKASEHLFIYLRKHYS